MTREIDFTLTPGTEFQAILPNLDCRAALSDFREKSKPELK
jgi:hypothetical protein